MKCDRLETLLIEYLDGRLAANDRAAVEQHLAFCPHCAARAEGFRSVSLSLEAWEAPELSPWFQARLRQRLAQEAERGFWSRSARVLLQPVYAWGLLTIVLAGLLVVWNVRPVPVAQKNPTSPKVTTVERHRLDEIMPVVEDYEIVADFEVLGELKTDKNKL